MTRFINQINLQDFGPKAQNKLRQSSVLVIGAGGLGCPALQYLAAAGVGKIGIADGDVVCVSNLNRQILFSISDAGKMKAESAAKKLYRQYRDVDFDIKTEFVTRENSIEMIKPYDLVLDCTDNFDARYLISDTCVALNKPFVYGSLYRYEGQISFFNHPNEENPYTYRDLFPAPPAENQIPDCSATGVLGVLPGIIGILQATEAIKYLSGLGTSLSGVLLYCNLRRLHFYEIKLPSRSASLPRPVLPEKTNGCAADNPEYKSLNWEEAAALYRASPADAVFLDVRETTGTKNSGVMSSLHIPISTLADNLNKLADKSTIIAFCQSGLVSSIAAKILAGSFPDKHIYTVKNGTESRAISSNKFSTNAKL